MHIRPNPEAEELFMQAYKEYKDQIFRHAYFQVFDRELAVDITQDAFMKTWQYVSDGNEIENVRAFLYKVATNLCLNFFRKKKETSLDELQEAGFDPGEDAEFMTHDVVAEERVIKLLQQIEEPYRTAVSLRYIEDFGPGEIAEITGEAPNTVSVRINRGVKMLRSLMEPNG